MLARWQTVTLRQPTSTSQIGRCRVWMQSRKFRWWPTLRCFARVTEVAVRTLLATGLEDAFVLPYGGDHGARLADGERERLLAIDIQAGAGGAGCSAGTAGFASMFSLMTQPVPPAQRGKSVALYLKNPRLQLRAGFQALENSARLFPSLGKPTGKAGGREEDLLKIMATKS
jgi:hypothetical protein